MKMWTKVAGAVGLLALVAGCSSASAAGPQTITVAVGTTSYATRAITLQKGKPYKLILDNKDIQVHDFSIDKINVTITKEPADHHDMSGMDMGGKDPDLHVSAEAGKTEEIDFTANQAGTYQFYCTVPGHKELGMYGTLTVK